MPRGRQRKPGDIFVKLGLYRDRLLRVGCNPGFQCSGILAAAESPYGRSLAKEMFGSVESSAESQVPSLNGSPERR